MFNRILFNLVQVFVVMAFAPLASGVLSRLKEMVQSKRGPSIFQLYRDLWKLFHKDEIVSEESSWIFRFTPYVLLLSTLMAGLMVPMLATTAPLSPLGGVLAFIGLLALGAILEASLGGLGLQDSVADALAIAVALMFVWIAGLLWHRRQGRYDRQKFPPLSSDEKRVARSKLVKGRSRETV